MVPEALVSAVEHTQPFARLPGDLLEDVILLNVHPSLCMSCFVSNPYHLPLASDNTKTQTSLKLKCGIICQELE
jgi:hypothetical protein